MPVSNDIYSTSMICTECARFDNALTLAFGTYPLQVVSSISGPNPTTLVAHFMNADLTSTATWVSDITLLGHSDSNTDGSGVSMLLSPNHRADWGDIFRFIVNDCHADRSHI